ncbi:MAG: Cof-type HAD-IIB family hydrolase [Chloroflexota bacterium]
MPIKLLASDLDGTLVSDLRHIPPRTQAAIQAAVKRGVQVTLATGREWGVTQEFMQMLGLNTPVICYQGALIYDPQTAKTIARQGLSLPLTRQLIDLARDHQLSLHLFLNGSVYTEFPTALSRSILGYIGSNIIEVDDLHQVIAAAPIKAMIVHAPTEVEALVGRLQDMLGKNSSVFRSLDPLIEVTSPQVSKGRALTTLAEYYGIPQSEVMAIGDQDNDIDMIEWAGLGVAMGNGSPGAKAAADVVAPPLSEEGAAWAIEQFILQTDGTVL